MSEQDDAVARLRAADPGEGAQVDLARLRAAVDARLAAEAGGGAGAPVVDLSRRRRGLRLAGVAAGMLLVAAAGFGIGRTSAPGPSPTGAPAAGAAVTQQEAAGGGAPGVGDDATRAVSPGGFQRQTFHAAGLRSDPGSATVWAFDATAGFGAQRLREVAAVLGVPGEPRREDGSWTVGDAGGTHVTLQPDGQATVSYYDPGNDPWYCPTGACPRTDLGPIPGDGEAIAAARQLLGDLGRDPDAFRYAVSKDEASGWIAVSATLLVEGEPLGASGWYLTWSGAGLQSLSGPLAPLVSLGERPLVGAAVAVGRIADPRFGTLDRMHVLPASGEAAGGATTAAPAGPPMPPAAGSPVPWPVEDVAITAAALVPVQWYATDGAALVLPGWQLSAADGRSWTVLALAEAALDMTP